ncbi:SPOC domain-containing protein 1 [Acomys russatus]|uniref:SPOC domain-containing protein 1 n=1 Tax=Acomys russatus TaxID=60746 RepID=UPI0021E210E1|nr:SPOC domain-containing protein 1 [Acomys russatus]
MGDGRVPVLIKEGLSERLPPLSPALPPRRVRRKCKKCGICPEDEEETGFPLRLGQIPHRNCQPTQGPPQSASPELSTALQSLLSPEDARPGEPDGNWGECTPESEFESMLFSKDVAQPGSLDHFFGFPGLFGGEPLSLVTEDRPQSPALYPGMLTGDSTEQHEVQLVFVVGSPEGSEVKAQPGSRIGQRQGLAAAVESCASSLEPLGGLCDASLGQGSPRHVKKRPWTDPGSCVEKQCTDDSSQDHLPEEASQKGCPQLDEMRVPCGVKIVHYVWSGTVIQLLGAISCSQPGGQIEALEDLMEVSSARRKKKRLTTPHPASWQCEPTGMEPMELLQQRAENPGDGPQSLEIAWYIPSTAGEQESAPLDVEVRATVVRAMQEALWTRAQELPDLLLKEEEVAGIAEGIEAALFHLTQDTNIRYKTKYRSLLFNLRDPRNSELFLKVAHCDVTPHDLVQMSSIQLAPKELSRWRDEEEKKGLDIIEQYQKELYRLPASKLTHKGEIEIQRDSDQMLTLEDLMEPMVPRECSPQALPGPLEDTTDQHQHHLWDTNCHICNGGKEARKDVSGSPPEPHTGSSHNMDRKSSTKPPGFPRVLMDMEKNVIQKAPDPAPVSSSEMLKAGETLPKEPQDSLSRLQMPAGPKNGLPSPPPWEGSLDMFSIKHFRAKAQLISGHSCQLVQALPQVIRSAGCLPPNNVWDLLDSMCPAKARDICVVRLCPHGSRDIKNYRLLYSYLNNKQCHCLASVEPVAMVLLPLPAFQPLPARLRPLGGPGLEATHTSLLLAVLFPKDGLPDTAVPSPMRKKVPKTVSFSKKVEMRRYQPEDSSEATLRGSSPHEEASHQSLAKDSLAPRTVCTPQGLPRGRGRQERGRGQRSSEEGWCHPQHLNLAGPIFPGIGRGQHLHRPSCFHRDLLQHLRVLVTMTQQFQASLWPPGQEPLLPSSAVSAVADPPGPIPDPSLGPVDGGGSACPLPEPSDSPERECGFSYQC